MSVVTFKPHDRKDIPLRVKWLNNKKANVCAIDNPESETTLEKETKWFDEYEKNPAKKFFTIYSDETPIGLMGLSNIDLNTKTAKLFILIGEDEYRGKGIGKTSLKYLVDYAFDDLKLDSVLLEVKRVNYPAIKLYESFGFVDNGPGDKEFRHMILANRE